MKLEITNNQQFSDWIEDVLFSIGTVEFLQLHVSDTVSLMRMLGAFTDPTMQIYFSYSVKTVRDISSYLENIMNTLKVPRVYFGLKKINEKSLFAEIKVLGAETLPIVPATCQTFNLVWYDIYEKKSDHAKVQKVVSLDEIAKDLLELDRMAKNAK